MENENLTHQLFITDSVFVSLHLLVGEYPHRRKLVVVPDPPLELLHIHAHHLSHEDVLGALLESREGVLPLFLALAS